MKIHPYIYVGVEEILAHTKTPKEAIYDLTTILARIQEVEIYDILSRGRKRELVIARQMICSILKKHYCLTLKKIGDLIGRDHSTIINNLENHKNDCKNDEKYKRMYDYVLNQHINKW